MTNSEIVTQTQKANYLKSLYFFIMSWIFRPEDYAKDLEKTTGKLNHKDAVRIRLPTQMRTKKETCSLCKERSVIKLKVSDNETRKLCYAHYADYKRKDFDYSVRFEKAELINQQLPLEKD